MYRVRASTTRINSDFYWKVEVVTECVPGELVKLWVSRGPEEKEYSDSEFAEILAKVDVESVCCSNCFNVETDSEPGTFSKTS